MPQKFDEALKIQWLEIIDRFSEKPIRQKLNQGWSIRQIREFFLYGSKPPRLTPSVEPPRKPGTLTYAQFLEWAKANNRPPRPIGRFEQDPPPITPVAPQETPEQARRRIIDQIGPNAFDQIPDAPAAS